MPTPSTDSTSDEGAVPRAEQERVLLQIEEGIVRDIMVELPRLVLGLVVLRNEVNAWSRMLDYLPAQKKKLAYQMHESVRYGLGVGSPDLLVVGGPFYRFLEVKRPSGIYTFPDGRVLRYDAGTLNPNQVKWHAMAERFRLPTSIVHSVEEAVRAVEVSRG